MTEEMHQHVVAELARLERDYDVRVLYACESGSRAWGLASRDSDYDVRFLYAHPADWYLSIEDRRDVIEEKLDHDLDVSGWELRKALRLLRKSNPSLLEWLNSPVVYREDERFTAEFRALAAKCYSPRRCFAHYLHMAWGNFREFLQGDEVRLKKYLYVLRPVLACRWIERSLGQVPMRFEELVDGVVENEVLRASITALVARKQAGDELDRGPRDEVLSEFLERELARLDTLAEPPEVASEAEALNVFFRRQCLAAT